MKVALKEHIHRQFLILANGYNKQGIKNIKTEKVLLAIAQNTQKKFLTSVKRGERISEIMNDMLINNQSKWIRFKVN
ncbi:hypothetical protein CUS89_11980 [Enterococcus mundtii]|uniref:Uncharacterized protein n=1 Tax=Enterococcus mundtii TaxID=53346 RepID=A0A2S7RR43_ENTMU|nr:hypothetical protein CUS89_11980 [Enterococcus mundtii]